MWCAFKRSGSTSARPTRSSITSVTSRSPDTAAATTRGFRLLLDRPNGTALVMSYWASLAAAQSAIVIELAESAGPLVVEVLRTDHYELAIDAG